MITTLDFNQVKKMTKMAATEKSDFLSGLLSIINLQNGCQSGRLSYNN